MNRDAHREDWIASPHGALHGELDVPGDKSVSHRAVMFAAIADGTSHIDGFLEGDDTLSTAAIFERMGVRIEAPGPRKRVVHGVGIDGLQAPSGMLGLRQCGHGHALAHGLLAGQAFDSVLTAIRPSRGARCSA
jgi:3-phosphoshikimate 1-carboxyvinyltransferase